MCPSGCRSKCYELSVCTRIGWQRRSVRRSWPGRGGPSGGACPAMWDSGQVGFCCSRRPDGHLTVHQHPFGFVAAYTQLHHVTQVVLLMAWLPLSSSLLLCLVHDVANNRLYGYRRCHLLPATEHAIMHWLDALQTPTRRATSAGKETRRRIRRGGGGGCAATSASGATRTRLAAVPLRRGPRRRTRCRPRCLQARVQRQPSA